MNANELTGSAIAAYLCAEAIQWAKANPKLSLINFESEKVTRLISALIAVATSLGIHATFDNSTGTLTVTGLLAGSLWTHSWEAVRQWAIQNMLYKGVVRPHHVAVSSPVVVTIPQEKR